MKQKNEFKEIALKKQTETVEHLEGEQALLQVKVNKSAKANMDVNMSLQLLLQGIENLFR